MIKEKCYLRFPTLPFIPKEPYDVIDTDYDNFALVSGAKDKSFIQVHIMQNKTSYLPLIINLIIISDILEDAKSRARIYRKVQACVGGIWVRCKQNQGHSTGL